MVKRFKPAILHDHARALRRDMTEAEKAIWRMLRSRRFDRIRFRRQVPIGNYIADFCCHELRLIIEIDGGQHDLGSDSERARTAFLQAEGYRVLRFWNNDVLANPEGVFAAIAEALQKHHPTPTLPPRRGGGNFSGKLD